jgi:hypothetical protein
LLGYAAGFSAALLRTVFTPAKALPPKRSHEAATEEPAFSALALMPWSIFRSIQKVIG